MLNTTFNEEPSYAPRKIESILRDRPFLRESGSKGAWYLVTYQYAFRFNAALSPSDAIVLTFQGEVVSMKLVPRTDVWSIRYVDVDVHVDGAESP